MWSVVVSICSFVLSDVGIHVICYGSAGHFFLFSWFFLFCLFGRDVSGLGLGRSLTPLVGLFTMQVGNVNGSII